MSILKGFLDNLASGAGNPKGNLGDFQHGARLYVDDAFRLAPKSKFLYHVNFNINREASRTIPQLREKHSNELNMLVKSIDLPSFQVETQTRHQYNKKRVVQQRIDYQPITCVFHDDNFGITTAMWEAYYRYYYRDGNYAQVDAAGKPVANVPAFKAPSNETSPYNRGSAFSSPENNQLRFGFDNDSFKPFFDNIIIYQMSRKRYTAFVLVNPIITQWQHDTMDQSLSDPVSNTCQIAYEAVFYTRGPVSEGSAPAGFATDHYDKTPSPISLKGGGVTSLMGAGGVLEGGLDVLSDITSGNAFANPGNLLGTVLKASNVIRAGGNLSSDGLRQEGFGILKDVIGSAAGIDVSGVANTAFSKGSGSGALKNLAIAGGTVALGGLLSGKSWSDVSGGLLGNRNAQDDLAKATTFKKAHIAAGGDATPDAINAAWDNLPEGVKQDQRDAAVSGAKNGEFN
jgi:hypothetical protein